MEPITFEEMRAVAVQSELLLLDGLRARALVARSETPNGDPVLERLREPPPRRRFQRKATARQAAVQDGKGRDRIFAYVHDHPGVTSKQLQTALGLSQGTVDRHLRNAVQGGQLGKTVIAGEAATYELAEITA